MDVIFTQLYKIDRENNEYSRQQFSESDNIDNYIIELLENITTDEGDRLYEFEPGSITIKTYLENIKEEIDLDEACEGLAKRLVQEEIQAQERYGHLNMEIQKGMMIVSLVRMTNTEKKIIISKADYNEFIEETTAAIRQGLPRKKKIYKSFVANISSNVEDTFSKLIVYDSNNRVSEYWWKNFLELEVVVEDEENTNRAFNAIKRDILNPLRKSHPYDYLNLWNATLVYFHSEGEFNLEIYKNETIGIYSPKDPSCDIGKLKEKIAKLPSKYKFDKRFNKTPSIIKEKEKKIEIKLTPEIDLTIKDAIPSKSKTIRSHKDADGYYIMIRSDEGYKYANELNNNI